MLHHLTSLRSSLPILRSLSRQLSSSPPNRTPPFFNPNSFSGQAPGDQPPSPRSQFPGIGIRRNPDSFSPSLSRDPADQPPSQPPRLGIGLRRNPDSFSLSASRGPADQPLSQPPRSGISLHPNPDSPFSGFSENPNQQVSERTMDFVRRVADAESMSHYVRPGMPEVNADMLHIKILRNNTFITLTDYKGNVKLKGSAGQLGGRSRHDSEAIAEHMGRKARAFGVKNVVVKVKGFTFFKKKKQAILAWREGFTHGKGDLKPIVYVEDVTRKAHNGCRLPRKRRI